jgi:sialate O-acetylesterase
MRKTMKNVLALVLATCALATALPAKGVELLVNGGFEKGEVTGDKSPAFKCEGWRRLLWKPTEWNSWLTNGQEDKALGQGNQAAEFRWGATFLCQYFSAKEGGAYTFSVETLNPGTDVSRWQPCIQVQWLHANDQPIGPIVTVAETDNTKAPVKQWNRLSGEASAPSGTAYGRLLLSVNNRGAGQMWVPTYFDNASVQGEPGTHSLPVSFAGSPYPMALAAIPESKPFHDSLSRYADDKDGNPLTFAKVSGPEWLTVQPDGTMAGTPAFRDAGDNLFVFQVSDTQGSTDKQTFTIPVEGILRLANVFDDDMVLQRDQPAPVWGQALPNTPVKLRMSTGEEVETTSDDSGAWSITLTAMKASLQGPVTMEVTSGTRKLTLKNLLVGDVWLCSGQSNMAWKLENTDDSKDLIADHPNLRLLTTPEKESPTPWTELPYHAKWEVCQPSTAAGFSAVAYHFGRKLNTDTGIPIGLILSSQGGTRIEPWTGGPLYNARVHPYARIPIKGVIWYQGEANIGDGSAYTEKMVKLVGDWRKMWNSDDLPFYFVQVAPFGYPHNAPDALPKLWEAQTRAMALIPNSGMVVANDVGNVENVHPANKVPVGERLARWALNKTYGIPEVICSGPVARAISAEGQRLRVSFDYAETGLVSRDGKPLSWFEIAGPDGTFIAADAVIDGDAVLVSAPGVTRPTAVRFAWRNMATPNLMSREGLPANSFRMELGSATQAGATEGPTTP